jgi:hypothetical protein
MFFPRLYKAGESPAISTELRTTIYDCLRLAVISVNPFDQSRWPLTYHAAMTLCCDKKGLFHFATNDLPPVLLGKFSETLLELLQEHDALADTFFVHELRGTKGKMRQKHERVPKGTNCTPYKPYVQYRHMVTIYRTGGHFELVVTHTSPYFYGRLQPSYGSRFEIKCI